MFDDFFPDCYTKTINAYSRMGEIGMKLEAAFMEVYEKFKLHFYKEVFHNFTDREATLTTVETFCMEIIYALDEPTINEFANFANISSPNAAYKIGKLIQKGYVEKIQSKEDRREYHLRVTQKYLDYYDISSRYVNLVVSRLKDQLSEEDQQHLKDVLETMSQQLMPELPAHVN